MKTHAALFVSRVISLFAVVILNTGIARSQIVIRGPIIGGVTDSSARVTIQLSGDAPVALEYSTSPGFTSPHITANLQASAAQHDFVTFDLTSLAPSTRYYLRAAINDVLKPFEIERSFTTFPTSGKDTSFVFTFGSCQRRTLNARQSNVFTLMKQVDPLLFLQIGDWTYPDEIISPAFAQDPNLVEASYELKYDPTNVMDTFLATRAVDYVYDDHDFAGNNSDGTSSGKQNALRGYDTYFPHYDLQNKEAGIWHKFTVGNVEFFMLDLRSERSPDDEAIQNTNGSYQFNPPPGHSILRGKHTTGSDELTWLFDGLKNSKARWKILMSSVTWNPGLQSFTQLALLYANLKKDPSKLYESADSWPAFPEDQDSLLALIKRENIRNVIVCSGDVHCGMMDDGKSSVMPEIVAANLQIPNSNLYGLLDSIGYAKTAWDRGGQKGDTVNTYGRVTISTSPEQSVLLEVVDERNTVVASYKVIDAESKVITKAPPRQELHLIGQTNDALIVQSNGIVGRVDIIDLLGNRLGTLRLDNTFEQRVQIPLTNFPTSGTYFLRFYDDAVANTDLKVEIRK